MALPLLITSILAAGVIKLVWTLARRTWGPLAALPGPWYTKYTSTVLSYRFFTGQRTQWVEELHRKYGNIVRLSPTEVDFSSPKAAKTIHSYKKPFLKSEFYSHFLNSLRGAHVVSTRDQVIHARHRRLLGGPMSESGLKQVEPIVESRVNLTIERLGREMEEMGYTNCMKWWLFMATDIIGELSFGESFHMLERGTKTEYAHDLELVAPIIGTMWTFPTLFYVSRRFGLPLFRDIAARGIRIREYAQQSIERYDRAVAANPQNVQPTLLTKLFLAGKKDEETMTKDEIVANAQAFIVAGTDTTAHTMTYLTWTLCKPENVGIKKQLLAELATLPEVFHNEDLKSLTYLDGVIRETLRLFAAAPAMLPRDVPRGGCEIDDVWMPEGAVVTTQAYSMHRNPAVYHEPEKFLPERWENPTQEMKDAFMPWGGGSRVCLGLHLASMEIRLATAKFFLKYPDATVSAAEGFSDADMEQIVYFLMFPKGKRCMIQAS
ncbi:cytochrome protein [Byssothecium circinans]|uniref:Cytochrome protein n=1 Tax=Byssothecium circinans TaxID=147558 RepID=A0A6A5U0B6_9PLEO|nr:cytochrome protein [Byssothecium circinans]